MIIPVWMGIAKMTYTITCTIIPEDGYFYDPIRKGHQIVHNIESITFARAIIQAPITAAS